MSTHTLVALALIGSGIGNLLAGATYNAVRSIRAEQVRARAEQAQAARAPWERGPR